MKNLMIYISPTGSFNNPRPDLTSNDAGQLAKVQIENSLRLGWKLEDILFYTSFPFEYGPVKAIILDGVEFFERKPQASKINAIVKLFEHNLIEKDKLYWFHDLDAFQLQPITESELELGNSDLALTDYGIWTRWNTGTMFFTSSSKDIFDRIKQVMYRHNINEEIALNKITDNDQNIRARVKKINKTYNLTSYDIKDYYQMVIKPIKIAHFHPYGVLKRVGPQRLLDFYMGDNSLHIPLITKELINIFKYHRIRPLETSSVAIFIPTYKRADRLSKVYKNAKDSSPLITNVYFIVEKDDRESIDALKTNRIPYIINERSKNYAGALNTAYLRTNEKYFFYGADDLDFKPGWLETCLKKMGDPIKVVGTNDLHYKDVLNGEHATHGLIDRDYIRTQSGIFDEKNLVFSETYVHFWMDREFIEFAKLRGVFAPCLEAIVEHLHWGYGLSEKDETYSLPEQNHAGSRDRNNYLKRKELWAEKF